MGQRDPFDSSRAVPESRAREAGASAGVGAAADSRAAEGLARIERHVRWMAPVGLVLLVGGILTWPASAHDPMRVYSFCALVCGTCLILGCVVYLRLLSKARGALASPSIEMLLDRRYRLTRGGNPWNATLWSLDSQEHPVASISWWQWASPMFMHADRIPVRVYGAPTSRAVIVVVGPDGVLAGRVGLGSSCPSEDPSASPGQGSVWLAKRVAGAAGAGSAAAPADPAVPAEEGS